MLDDENLKEMMKSVDARASYIGLPKECYEKRVVQIEDNGINVAYVHKHPKDEIVMISCNATPSGPEITGVVEGTAYAMSKVFRKMGISIPLRDVRNHS